MSDPGPPPNLSNVRRIGVFKFRNIGDVLMITPALRALRERFPAAEITVAVNSVTDGMLHGNPHIDRVLTYERHRKKSALFSRIAYELKFAKMIRRSRFDLTVDFTSGDRPAGYSFISGAGVRLAFRDWQGRFNWRNRAYTAAFVAPRTPLHEVERHLLLLNHIGIPSTDKRLCLVVDPAAREWATKTLQPQRPRKIVHIHPVARWLFKCWDDRKMAAIIDWLQQEKKAAVVVTSSDNPRELAKTDGIASLCQIPPVILSGPVSLLQLAALSEQADCFFGVDTAPMHIAAAVGTPAVALFGPTNPESWRPWCERQITLRKECRCDRAGRQDCDWSKVRDCLQQITVAEAQAALSKFL